MNGIITLAVKDLRLLVRDHFGMFWVIVFPLLMALFFGSLFSGNDSGAGSMKIALVGDSSEVTQLFFNQLKSSEVLKTITMPLDSAREMVSRGKLTAYVHYLPAESDGQAFLSFGRDSIEVGIDPSRKAEAAYLQGLISQAYFMRLKTMFSDPVEMQKTLHGGLAIIDSLSWLNRQQQSLLKNALQNLDTLLLSSDTILAQGSQQNGPFSDIRIKFTDVTNKENRPRSSWEITFPQSLLWALIGCAATFALSIVTERRTGTYFRLRVAPLNRLQILLGKGLACFIACTVVCALLMALGIVVFGVHISSLPLLVLSILSAAFSFVGIMMLISVLGKSERTVAGSSWAILLVFSMIGGGMIPLMFMPSWVAALSNFSPMKWCVLALEGAIWRGFGFNDMLLPISILVGVGLAGFAIGTWTLTATERNN